jgi:DinB superfamily
MAMTQEFAALFSRDLTKLAQQVQAFPDEASLWKRCGTMNSAGNPVLHLEGNLREYIGRQLGGVAFCRDRPLEFSAAGVPAADLVRRIEEVKGVVAGTFSGLSEERLKATFPENVLGVPISTRQFLIHLNGHLNYHLGQIDTLRRILNEGAALEYAGLR